MYGCVDRCGTSMDAILVKGLHEAVMCGISSAVQCCV
jgi:hypothetical protein